MSYVNTKIAQLCAINEIEYANKSIDLLNTRIKLYSTLLEHLEDNKPLFFQRKKLLEYNNKVVNYNYILEELYKELNDELSSINKLYNNIEN